jgi:hypothetical protein
MLSNEAVLCACDQCPCPGSRPCHFSVLGECERECCSVLYVQVVVGVVCVCYEEWFVKRCCPLGGV